MTIKIASNQSQASALKNFYLKSCTVSSDLSIIKYALKWMASFGSQARVPEIQNAIYGINVLQTGVGVGGLVRKSAFGTDSLTWLNAASLTFLRLQGLNLVSSARWTTICARIYSATFMAQSIQYFNSCMTRLKSGKAETGLFWRIADAVNCLILGTLYLFFNPAPETLLTLESADVGFGFGKRNLFPEKQRLDKLSSAYLPKKMLS